MQAMVELYEFLLKCSCDQAQAAPPPRKFRMSGRGLHESPWLMQKPCSVVLRDTLLRLAKQKV